MCDRKCQVNNNVHRSTTMARRYYTGPRATGVAPRSLQLRLRDRVAAEHKIRAPYRAVVRQVTDEWGYLVSFLSCGHEAGQHEIGKKLACHDCKSDRIDAAMAER